MTVHEAHPPKSMIEKISTRLLPHGVDLQRCPGGTGSNFNPAALMAGLTDDDRWLVRLAEQVWQVRFLDDQRYREPMINNLHLWGARRFLLSQPSLEMSGNLHRRLADLVCESYIFDRSISRDAAKSQLNVGSERWRQLRNHVADLINRINQAEQMIARHLNQQIL